MTEPAGSLALVRFVRPIGTFTALPDGADQRRHPARLSRFDGVLGLGIDAGEWLPPALTHLTLGSLVADALAGDRATQSSSDGSFDRRSSPGSASGDRPSSTALDAPAAADSRTHDHSESVERGNEEPRVRDVLRSGGEAASGPDETLLRTATTGRAAPGSTTGEDADRDDSQRSSAEGTSDDSSSLARSSPTEADNAVETETNASSGAGNATDANEQTTVRTAGRPDGSSVTGDGPRVPRTTVRETPPSQARERPAASGSPTTGSAEPSVDPPADDAPSSSFPATDRDGNSNTRSRPVTDSGREGTSAFGDAPSMATLQGGVEGSVADAEPSPSPSSRTGIDVGTTGAGGSEPRMTVRRDDPSGSEAPGPGGSDDVDGASGGDATSGGRDSTGQRGAEPSTALADRSLVDSVDVDRLADRLYREIEDRKRIERERRGR